MAVPAGPTEQRYVGNGVSTIFTVPFLVIQASDLAVYIDGVKLTSGYTQSGAGNPTSTVTFTIAPAVNAQILLALEVPFERLNDYQENGDFLARTVNNDYDRIWQALKQLLRYSDRSLRLGQFDVDGQGWYRAKGNGIRDLHDPVQPQDAATMQWTDEFVASLIAKITGPINNAANIFYQAPDGTAHVLQDLSGPDGGRLIGHDSWNVGDRISNLKFPEQFASLQDWAASGGSLGIKGGAYTTTSELAFPFGTVVHTFGDVVIDASAAATLGNFPNSCVARLGGGGFSAIPALNINYLKGANLLSFVAPHGLNVGDVFAIYNPTDFSYSSFRTYYRAGEFCRVAAVTSSTQVRLTKPLYSGYTAAAVNVYKMNGGSFNLKGSLKVIAPETLPSVMGIRAQRLIDSNVTGLKGYSKQSSSAMEFEKCFNVEGGALVAEQGLMSGTGNDYGLIFSNCQHMRMEGYFSASRHGVTTGGYGDIGSVPCRDIVVRGTATTTFEGQAHAVDTHGNTEYFTFEGDIYGGFDGGGNHLTIKGNVFAADDGIAFYHAEMTGYDRNYSGVRVYADTDPALLSRGVIDLGGNNTSSAAADTIGGVFDCSGMVVYAPSAMSIFKLIQRNSNATNIRVKLDGAQVAAAAVGYESVRATNSGGQVFARVSMAGFEAPNEAAQVHTAFEVTGVSISGFVDIPVTTSVASGSAVVTFPSGIFKDPPIVTTGLNTTSLGATFVTSNSNTPTVTNVTVLAKTTNAGNFGAAGTVRVYWRASTAR